MQQIRLLLCDSTTAVASRIVLHIGTQKSGSTFLQQAIRTQAEVLAQAGWLYPMRWARRERSYNQEAPMYGGAPGGFSWVTEARTQRLTVAWNRMLREVRSWDGPVLLSAEALSTLRTRDAEKIVKSLGAPIEVVITARTLERIIPSSWQQHIRNGRGEGYERYLRRIEDEFRVGEGRAGLADGYEGDLMRGFWRAYLISGLTRRWQDLTGGQVRVVTVPTSGPPDVLWQRFSQACGLSEILPTQPPTLTQAEANIGITAPEAHALASVNRAMLTTGMPDLARRRLRFIIVREGFQPRDDRGPSLAVPEANREIVKSWSKFDVDELAATSAIIIGETKELESNFAGAPADPSPSQISDAAYVALQKVFEFAPPEQYLWVRRAQRKVKRLLRAT